MNNLLVREAIPCRAYVDDDIASDDLGVAARELLGYDLLMREQETGKANDNLADRLASVFNRLDIQPFTHRSVEDYGNAMLRKLNHHPIWWAFSPLWAFCTFMCFYECIPNRQQFEWVWRPINKYSRPVPEFALQTAVDIKHMMPEAEIGIYALEAIQAPIYDDPFLTVTHRHANGRRDFFFLEVWNEPQFKVSFGQNPSTNHKT